LPRILETDPAIKEMSPKPGDVVKIVRKSETAGESVYYRVVIKAS
jgi:DNA-directed RNA polymerase subunit H